MNTLDKYEAILKLKAENLLAAEEHRRIGLALLELVKKKDMALKYYLDEIIYDPELMLSDKSRPGQSHWTITAKEAIDLTEQLK